MRYVTAADLIEVLYRGLAEHTTAASILDRALRHATIVVTSWQSYRMRHTDHKKGHPN